MTKTHTNILRVVLLLVATVAAGCADPSSYRAEGFKMFGEAFKCYSVDTSLHEVVVLDSVTVHIVGDRKHFGWDRAAAYGSPILGYATSKNEIYVFGRRQNGKIVIDQAVLGHELNHLLQFRNRNIANPDAIE